MERLIYLDNAATSYPKPPQVVEAVSRYLRGAGSPVRSSHRMSLEASRSIHCARERVAELVGLDDPLRVIFTANATAAINIALQGVLAPGDHVVTTSVEHNSVMRPLRMLEHSGVDVTVVECTEDGLATCDCIADALRPNTTVVVMTHASNVLGAIQPLAEVGELCRRKGVVMCVDAAQTLGAVPIGVEREGLDLLAFSGHKSLYGPQGTGGLVLGRGFDVSRLRPLMYGGTGSRSESEEQPDFLPDMLESGTANGPGLAGLAEGMGFVLSTGVDEIRRQESALTHRLMNGLSSIPGVTVYGPSSTSARSAVVSFRIDGLDPSEAAFRFDNEYGIMCRAGLHCSPAAHRTAGTFPEGTIRFGIGYFNTVEDIDIAIEATRALSVAMRPK